MITSLGLRNIIWAGVSLFLVMAVVLGEASKTTTSQVRCIASARQALLRFKGGIEDYYDTLSSWTSGEEDCCKWGGIKCENQTNHVIMLDLSSRFKRQKYVDDSSYFDEYDGYTSPPANFGCEIDSSLSELIYLKHIDFQNNHFTRIPHFIGVFTGLSGRIPKGTQLQSFDEATYSRNMGLCGPPVKTKCPGDKTILLPPG